MTPLNVPPPPACHPDAEADWKPVPGWPHLADDHGRVCTAKGRILAQRTNNSGYQLVDLWNPETKAKRTVTVQWCVLSAHRGERPDGHEARHGDAGPSDNHLANFRGDGWGTKADNHADKADPQPPAPSYPCRNADKGCQGKALNPGRRCVACVEQVGIQAAAMLRDGQNLQAVAGHFGYKTGDWVFGLAVKYGGYPAELKDRARTQQPRPRGFRGWALRRLGAA